MVGGTTAPTAVQRWMVIAMDEYTAMEESYKNGYDKGYADAKGELVRCKNCVHRKEKVCCNPSAGMWVGVALKDSDFCSYGERRKDG